MTVNNTCKGVLVCDENGKDLRMMVSDIVVCATGGFGQLYEDTTNPEVATGDGVSMAYRAARGACGPGVHPVPSDGFLPSAE